MVGRLILVLGDQLTHNAGALAQADPARDIVVMAEVATETGYVPHHPQKIALVLSAMRHFAQELQERGWQVLYTRLDDPDSSGSIPGELLRRAQETGIGAVVVMQPGEWRLRLSLATAPLDIVIVPDDRFLCPAAVFADWARGRKSLRMEHFYRAMRRRSGLLMDGDQPAGGQWNFDHDNRRPARDDLLRAPPLRHEPDSVTCEVLDLVSARFASAFGRLDGFGWATDRRGALAALDHFLRRHLPEFGTYQDAMLAGDGFLHHALIAPYLNIGLLTPHEVCAAAEAEYRSGRAPINAVEGFIRQILGWREYVRGIYDLHGPDYAAQNALDHRNALPALFWGAPTKMRCVGHVIAQTRNHAYAHHIQRLMVTGNFALLSGIDPAELHRWYLAVYADAFEWVEAPNVIGMSQFADGGVLGSKPYVSSGAYIDRMSDYCGGCAYDVRQRTGAGACPFNRLYWHFLVRHRARFASNPRMAQMYRTWDRFAPDHQADVLQGGDAFLEALHTGAPV